MKELQDQAKRLLCENYQLWAQIEKSRDPRKYARESGHNTQSITRDKGKGPIPPDDDDDNL